MDLDLSYNNIYVKMTRFIQGFTNLIVGKENNAWKIRH